MFSPYARWIVLIGATALAAAATQWLAALVGDPLTIPAQPGTQETMSLPIVLTSAVAGVVAATALVGTAVLRRVTDRALQIALALGMFVLAGSMLPVAAAWQTVANPWGLTALHVVVGAVVLTGLVPALEGGEDRTAPA